MFRMDILYESLMRFYFICTVNASYTSYNSILLKWSLNHWWAMTSGHRNGQAKWNCVSLYIKRCNIKKWTSYLIDRAFWSTSGVGVCSSIGVVRRLGHWHALMPGHGAQWITAIIQCSFQVCRWSMTTSRYWLPWAPLKQVHPKHHVVTPNSLPGVGSDSHHIIKATLTFINEPVPELPAAP